MGCGAALAQQLQAVLTECKVARVESITCIQGCLIRVHTLEFANSVQLQHSTTKYLSLS